MSQNKKSCSRFAVFLFQCKQTGKMWLHTRLKKPTASMLVWIGIIFRAFGSKTRGLDFVLKGRRVAEVKSAHSVIRKIIHNDKAVEEFAPLSPKKPKRSIEIYQKRILILKIPTIKDNEVVEKGALIIKFTEVFIPLFNALNLRQLTKYFRVILEPSWVGYALPEILLWSSIGKEKVIVFSPYADDFNLLSACASNLTPITIGPADWVDTSKFYVMPEQEKVYDSIYMANFNPIKRVERYIRAVHRISKKQPNYKAALILAGHGQAKEDVLATLDCYNQNSAIDVFQSLPATSINEIFNKSKVNILVSLREGANKGLAEGFFANTPALLMRESAGGNYLHINEKSGRIYDDADLEEGLLWFSQHYADFSAREWA
ncbi:MAG: glycosyltransferase, partial [Gammaproteobacteria bacterium]|nr:glycosyltransferase [Gammaproteobacteria bacterium]